MLAKCIVPQSQLYSTGAGVTARIPATSAVSPVCVEGSFWPPEPAALANVTVSGPSGNAQVKGLGDAAFYADVPLSASASVTVSVTRADLGTVLSQEVTWTPTDLAQLTDSEDTTLIRKHDSLLLTASGSGAVLTIDADGDANVDLTGVPGDQWSFTYSTPGTFVAKAFIDDVEVGSLTVKVVSATFPLKVACQVGYTRPVNVTVNGVLDTEVLLLPSAASDLEVSVADANANPVVLSVKPFRRGTPELVARLGAADGPVIAEREVDEFTLAFSNTAFFIIDQDTRSSNVSAAIKPLILDLEFRFNVFASQTRFEAGATDFTSNTNEFEPVPDPRNSETNGLLRYKLEMPVGENKACYSVRVFQDGVPVSFSE
jgi:hypothetical protein